MPIAVETVNAVEAIFACRIREGSAPGSAWAAFDHAGVVASGGFGEARVGGGASGPDTLFRVASCTKRFTAAALLLLRDRGDLDLDADQLVWHLPGATGRLRLEVRMTPLIGGRAQTSTVAVEGADGKR